MSKHTVHNHWLTFPSFFTDRRRKCTVRVLAPSELERRRARVIPQCNDVTPIIFIWPEYEIDHVAGLVPRPTRMINDGENSASGGGSAPVPFFMGLRMER